MRPEEVAFRKRSKFKYLHKKSFVFFNEEAKRNSKNLQNVKMIKKFSLRFIFQRFSFKNFKYFLIQLLKAFLGKINLH